MNKQKSIAVFAAIAAIAMTTIGLSGDSTTALMVSSPSTLESEGVGMLGHIQYTVRDSNENIVKYVQGDNTVVNHGKDCVAEMAFGDDEAECNSTSAFTFIGIGNGTTGVTIPAYNDEVQLTNSTTTGCSGSSGDSGEINRFGSGDGVTVTRTTAAVNGTDGSSGTGTVVEINTGTAFDFTAGNATTVRQSGIFNYGITEASGVCSNVPKANGNMFALQELNSANGIVVTDGDSLSVKWTITVG